MGGCASTGRHPAVSHRAHAIGTNTVTDITITLVATCAEIGSYGHRRSSP